MTKTPMTFEVLKCRDCVDCWLTEAIDYGSEGEVYSAFFSGYRAEQRARDYAAWMNCQPYNAQIGRVPAVGPA